MAKSYYLYEGNRWTVSNPLWRSYEVGITIKRNQWAHLFYGPVPPERMSLEELRELPITIDAVETPNRLIFDDYRTDTDVGTQQMISATKALADRTQEPDLRNSLYVTIKENVFRQFYSSFTSRSN